MLHQNAVDDEALNYALYSSVLSVTLPYIVIARSSCDVPAHRRKALTGRSGNLKERFLRSARNDRC